MYSKPRAEPSIKMFAQRRPAALSESTREQLFTERYEVLLTWALQFTNQQRDAAEDLVQDAFVQFMLARTACRLRRVAADLRLRVFRKEPSTGSVLILRFFHDYFPTEIASVLCVESCGDG